MRQIVLDTETTGRETALGNRVIEIGCLELIDRKLTGKHFHQYINPERDSEAGALAVHGLTQEFLTSFPLFHAVAENFLDFIKDAQLIIHNAPFDLGFLNYELNLTGKKYGKIEQYCTILDTLPLARQLHPGQRNSLDALCKRYSVDNSQRDLHGALLDAELLAKVYLAMTGGQTSLFDEEVSSNSSSTIVTEVLTSPLPTTFAIPTRVIQATDAELLAHQNTLEIIAKKSKKESVWQ